MDRAPARRAPVWLWPALLTALVAAWRSTGAQLWLDELATWSVATRPLGDLGRLLHHTDAVLGPYYLLMHAWLAVAGDSTLALRLPSIAAMTLAAGLTAVLAERLFGRRAGLLAGVLFALVPTTSRYAQEARPYAFAVAFGVLATILLIRAWDRPTWRRWALYGASVVLLGLAHLVALLLLAAHAAIALTRHRRARHAAAGRLGVWRRAPASGRDADGGPDRRPWQWAAATVLAGAALAPLVVPGAGQLHAQLSWVPRPDPRDLLATPGGVNGSAVVGGYLLGLATLGWGGGRPRGPLGGRWTRGVGLAVLLSPALLFVAAQATSIWVPRYLVFTVPLLCVLAGAALDALSTPAALAALLAIALLGAPDQLTLRHTHQTPGRPIDYAGAAAIIQAGAEPGDGLVLHPRDRVRLLDIGLAYHLRGHPRPRDVLVTRDQLATASLWATECTDPAACLTGVARVWLVRPGRYPADPLAGLRDAKARALSSYAVVGRWTVHGLTIALLRRGA